MIRAAVLVLALGSCAFAQKHPAITAGIASGTIALVPCLPAVESATTCLAIGAIAGLAIGGITGLVTTFADTNAHELPPFEEPEPPIVRKKKTETAPPPEPVPVSVDAGVPLADAAEPAMAIDAAL
jgi:outer membrane biosynthesis protein TonB